MATCIRNGPPNSEPRLQPRVRSPLSENLSPATFPRSPLSFVSPQSLPQLKWNSGLSSPTLVTHILHDGGDDDDEEYKEDDEMSISSVSDAGGGNELFSDYDIEDVEAEIVGRRYDEEQVFGPHKCSSKLNRGVLENKNLRIEVPFGKRRVTDGELGLRKFALKNSTPASCLPHERPHTLSSKVYLSGLTSNFRYVCYC